METFKYGLEPYNGMSTRYTCPACGTKKSFVRYMDLTTREYVGDDIGRCNREQHCGYHKKPDSNAVVTLKPSEVVFKETDYLPKTILKNSRDDYLFKYLTTKFPKEKVLKAFSKYKVFSDNSKYHRATVYPQIDIKGRIRTAKIMLYDNNGKRIKYPYSVIGWMHKELYDDFQLEQCLFGEHLLADKEAIQTLVGLVESEKTAVILSIRYPSVTWVASGGISNLSPKKLKILNGFRVTAFPDKGAADYWKRKLSPFDIRVSDVLERTDYISDGDDLADYILTKIED